LGRTEARTGRNPKLHRRKPPFEIRDERAIATRPILPVDSGAELRLMRISREIGGQNPEVDRKSLQV
jgi:hypothetical protein